MSQQLREQYEPLHGFRTEFDKALQERWCPTCVYKPQPHPHPRPHPSPHHQPVGAFSYVCSPGLGCHEDHRAPGHGTDGVRYSNMQACQAQCPTKPKRT
jgi:hypothetical protein